MTGGGHGLSCVPPVMPRSSGDGPGLAPDDRAHAADVAARAGPFTTIGSYLGTTLPDAWPDLVHKGRFVDRRNGTPMEMDAYSVYMALKATGGCDIASRRARMFVVATIDRRLRACGLLWRHGVWSPEAEETHLRFTAAGIRLLVEAYADGLYSDRDRLFAVLLQHVGHVEPLDMGPWFLHDTLELPALAHLAPEQPFASSVWGSTPGNGLVLNTHVDTLSTLIDALDRVDMPAADHARLSALADQALGTLLAVLDQRASWWWPLFCALDGQVRRFVLCHPRPRSRLVNIVKWRLVIGGYYAARRWIKAACPRFQLTDGYLERDIGLIGHFVEYHMVNLHDLMRLVVVCERSGRLAAPARARILGVVDAAIDHTCAGAYAAYIRSTFAWDGRAAILAEAIAARAALDPARSPSPRRAEMLAAILDAVPPTPAMLGYDPFILTGDAGALLRNPSNRPSPAGDRKHRG